jgi:hypothetical protein
MPPVIAPSPITATQWFLRPCARTHAAGTLGAPDFCCSPSAPLQTIAWNLHAHCQALHERYVLPATASTSVLLHSPRLRGLLRAGKGDASQEVAVVYLSTQFYVGITHLKIARDRHAERGGDGRGGVPRAKGVILALCPVRKPCRAPALPPCQPRMHATACSRMRPCSTP